MSSLQFDLTIIGSGPGGYVAAIRASQLGLKTALIEKSSTLGGTCLNVGCIPSKALLDSSEHFFQAQNHFKTHGIEFEDIKLNLEQMMKRKSKVVKKLTQGISHLMKKNKVSVYQGFGRLKNPHTVQVIQQKDGSILDISTQNILLATGSMPKELPHIKFNQKYILSSTEVLSLNKVPKKMAVIGAGAIGLELGSVWNRLGSEVTILEYSSKIAGSMDEELSEKLLKILKKQGINFILESHVKAIYPPQNLVNYEEIKTKTSQSIEADIILMATGRLPYSQGLGLEHLGIETDSQGFVRINQSFQTKYPHIYAIGDLVPGPMLAHKAEEEGVAVAEIIATGHGHVNKNTLPSVIYTEPELASVGKTEEQLKQEKIPYKKGTFPFLANGRAQAMGATEGMTKILAHKETDKILGSHILGPRASDLLGELIVAMEFEGRTEDIARSFHSHPTFTETLREAALDLAQRARQI